MTKPLTTDEYKSLIKDHYPVVIGGYSGLEYADTDTVREKLRSILRGLYEKHGSRLLVVSGGTKIGIGMVYKIAKELDLPTLGIVSEQASFEAISAACDAVLFVADPNGTWEVTTPEGDSMMVDAASTGEMYYFGGGEVAVKEIQEARQKGIPVTLFPQFMPDPEKVLSKRKTKPDFEAMPTKFI